MECEIVGRILTIYNFRSQLTLTAFTSNSRMENPMYAETVSPQTTAEAQPAHQPAHPGAPRSATHDVDQHRDPRPDPHPGHSTGPRTAEGKARSSRNALKHGLTSEEAVLPEEDGADFEALRQGFVDDLRPAGETEETLAEIMAVMTWKLRRVWRMEPGVFASWRAKAGRHASAGAVWALDCMADASLEKLGRHEARCFRALMQSEARLRLLQKLRAAGLERAYRASNRPRASDSRDGANGKIAKRTPPTEWVPMGSTALEPQIAQIDADEPRARNGVRSEGEASGSTDGANGENAKRTRGGEWVPMGSTALEPQIAQIDAYQQRVGNGVRSEGEASGSTDGANGENAKRTPRAPRGRTLSEADAQALLDALPVAPLPPHPAHGAAVRDEVSLLVRGPDGHLRELARRVVSEI
jgi:hypothetical protein